MHKGIPCSIAQGDQLMLVAHLNFANVCQTRQLKFRPGLSVLVTVPAAFVGVVVAAAVVCYPWHE